MKLEPAQFNGNVSGMYDTEPAGISILAKVLSFLLIGAATSVFVSVLLNKSGLHVSSNGNELLLGSAVTSSAKTGSASASSETYQLKLRSPTVLNGHSRDEVLEMRKREVARHANLFGKGYEPHSAAFAGLHDQSAWLGTLGKFGYADPQQATEGPADAARWLLNPLLLVGAEVWPINPTLQRTKLAPDVFGHRQIQSYLNGKTELPFVCKPLGMTWDPSNSSGMVTYDVGAFLSDRRKADTNQVVLSTMAEIEFHMLNARDLNFRYCYTSPTLAKNMIIRRGSETPFELTDGLTDDASGNLTTTSSSSAGKFLLTGSYPASIEFHLWQNEPSDVTTPDVRFTVQFESMTELSSAARQWIDYFRGSQDALCVAGLALAEIAVNPQLDHSAAQDRAILASQRLEALDVIQDALPKLQGNVEREVRRFVNGKELTVGYSIFSRGAIVMKRLQGLPEYQQLLAEYNKPHWQTLHGLRQAQ